jgi:hypothetical protein
MRAMQESHPGAEKDRRLASLGINVTAPPTAKSLGIPEILPLHVRTFLECLQHVDAPRRVREQILPECDQVNLARFLMLTSYPKFEQSLLEARENRGKQRARLMGKILRKSFRKETRRHLATSPGSRIM